MNLRKEAWKIQDCRDSNPDIQAQCSALTNWAQQAYWEQVISCSRAVLSERHSTFFFFPELVSVLLVSFRYPFVLICSVWSSKDEILGCERFIWNP